MPTLGETWSVLEYSGGPASQTEAVVIAIGPTIVRLVTRTGRRIAVPASTWERAWRRVAEAPLPPQTCSFCRQTAFFRHALEREPVWVCEDHLPQGARALFPGEARSPNVALLEQHCPLCEATDVQVQPALIRLSGTRTTTHCVCGKCALHWSPLLGRGLGDDGSTLASDLSILIENDPRIFCVQMGFVLYRDFCRALQMGDVRAFRGIPVQMKSEMGDTLALVYSRAGVEPKLPNEEPPKPATFDFLAATTTIKPKSEWLRRSRAFSTCQVTSVEDDVVYYEISKELALSSPRKDFLRHWLPRLQNLSTPDEKSFWRRVETREIVQVVRPTSVQVSNHQVPYLKRDGTIETTPAATFARLYRDLPHPDGHFWYSEEGQVFEAEREGETIRLRRRDAEGERTESPHDLYTKYTPVLFTEELGNLVRARSRWQNLETGREGVVIDIVIAGDTAFAQFEPDGSERQLIESSVFMQGHQHLLTPAPCKVDETWVSLDEPERRGLVLVADEHPYSRAVIKWNNGDESRIDHETLVTRYRRLEIRSYWEFLDCET